MRLLPNIANTIAHWPFQGSLVDISGNGLGVATLNNITLLPGGLEQYGAFDACLQGFKFDTNTYLQAPLTALLQMPGPWTIQWLMKQTATNTGDQPWFTLANPAGRSGGAAPDRIGSIFTAFWSDLTPGRHPYWTDLTHGSNLPTSAGLCWDTTEAAFGVAPGVVHAMAVRYNSDGVAGHASSVDLFIDGVKQTSTIPPTGNNTNTPAIVGNERFYVGGCEGPGYTMFLNSLIGDMRVLRGVARSDAALLADATAQLGPCAADLSYRGVNIRLGKSR